MDKNLFCTILNLTNQGRYSYLIEKSAEFKSIWLIKDTSGEFVVATEDSYRCIPVWPGKQFADFFITDWWMNYQSEKMNLGSFFDWVDELAANDIRIAGFPDFAFESRIVKAKDIQRHMIAECYLHE